MITQCSICQINTAGEHEWNCPNHPRFGYIKPNLNITTNVLPEENDIKINIEMTELKPCPFCKTKPERIKVEKTWNGKIPPDIKHPLSGKCGLSNKSFYDDEWQSRPLESALEAQVADMQSRLKKAVGEIKKYIETLEKSYTNFDLKTGAGIVLWIIEKHFPELEKKK